MRLSRQLGAMGWTAVAVAGLFSAETTGPATLPETAEARAAGDWALRLLTAQFRSATRGNFQNPALWTSQPGALRRMTKTGALDAIFKLYSAGSMTASTAAETLTEGIPTVPPGDPLFGAVYCDLNAPTFDEQGRPHFPIVDPRAYRGGRGASVEGFAYTGGAAGTVTPEQTENADDQRLPMPVKWIYLLADGVTAGTLDATGAFVPLASGPAGFTSTAAPSAENPIVSRVAFWADDASCRINVNTASEGVFWDTPRCDTVEERAYGKHQPAAHEHVRAMAHPAAVSLSSVLFPGQRLHLPQADSSGLAPLALEKARALWSLTPLLQAGGSDGGTVAPPDFAVTPPAETTAPYDSVEDYLAAAADRAAPAIAPESAPFFLTVRSRAPELTVFETPRISLWPVSVDSSRRTSFDIAALEATQPGPAEAGHARYNVQSFQRYDPYSVTIEFFSRYTDSPWSPNERLYWYLQRALASPSMGSATGTLDSKYGNNLRWILAAMLDYVRSANPVDPQLPPAGRYAWGGGPTAPGFGQIRPLQVELSTSSLASGLFFISPGVPRGYGRMATINGLGLWVGKNTRVAGGVVQGSTPTLANWQTYAADPRWEYEQFEAGLVLNGFCPAHGWPAYIPRLGFQMVSARRFSIPSTTVPSVTLAGTPLSPFQDRTQSGFSGPTQSTPSVPAVNTVWWGGSMAPPTMLTAPIPLAAWSRTNWSGRPASQADDDLVAFSGTNRVTANQLAILMGHYTELLASNLLSEINSDWPPFVLPGPVKPLGSMTSRFASARTDGMMPFDSEDILQSLLLSHGDPRIPAPVRIVGTDFMVGKTGAENVGLVPHPQYGLARIAMRTRAPVSVVDPFGVRGPGDVGGYFGSAVNYDLQHLPDFPYAPDDPASIPLFYSQTPAVYRDSVPINAGGFDLGRITSGVGAQSGPFTPDLTGDFDNGVGPAPDGPYINMPDGGDVRAYSISGGTPYFDDLEAPWQENPATFSPYRHMPSAVMFGSLPTGVVSQKPWQTLLFRPEPRLADGTRVGHFGATGPADRHLLDFYRMPIVTPWKMSDYVSTAGRLNMNYQILPFGNIHRSTAMHALLKAQKLLAIPDDAGNRYKSPGNTDRWRHHIDTAATLAPWDAKFASGGVFLQPSEICEQWMVPEGLPPSAADLDQRMAAFWASHRLTGDNSKERVYANIYPHLTTRSLTFLVHVVAESIQKSADSAPNRFDPAKDVVTGRVRRASYLERWLDLDDPGLIDIPMAVATGQESTIPDLPWDFRTVDAGMTAAASAAPAPRLANATPPEDFRKGTPTLQVEPGGKGLRVTWNGAAGQVIDVESSTDLTTWTHVASRSVGLGTAAADSQFTLDLTARSASQKKHEFFRARSAVPAP